jgi:hypothetical protein
MTMTEAERALLTWNACKAAVSTLRGPTPDWLMESCVFWEARVADLEAAGGEQTADINTPLKRGDASEYEYCHQRIDRLGKRYVEQALSTKAADAKIERLSESVTDLQNDLHRANMRTELVERKVEEDLKRMNHQIAEIQKIRNWCAGHQHTYNARDDHPYFTTTPIDVSEL